MADAAHAPSSGARRRIVAGVALVAVIAAGLAVHGWLTGAVSDVAGDALYAGAAYLGVIALLPRLRPASAGAIAVAWCFAVELLQLTGLPQVWRAELPVLGLVLGAGFDARDLLVYAAAVAASAGVDVVIARRKRADRVGPARR